MPSRTSFYCAEWFETSEGFSALVGEPYEPECLEKWGIYALNVEQIKLPITRPPRVKDILLYCQARGVVSQHDTVKDAKAGLVRMVEQYNRAHFFPLAGVYRWEENHWDQIRSLF